MRKEKEENGILSHLHHHDSYRSRDLGAFEHGLLDGDMILQVSDFIYKFKKETYLKTVNYMENKFHVVKLHFYY